MEITPLLRLRAVAALTVTLFLALVTFAPALAQAGIIHVDWEQDFAGNSLDAGQIIDDEFQSGGDVSFTVSVASATGVAAIFDSSNPTAGNADLGSPNETCTPAGPGVGSGGQAGSPGANCAAQNNVLVITDNITDSDGDGLIDAPGDDENGGVITFVFADAVALEQAYVLDQEPGTALTIRMYSDAAGTNLINTVTASGFGANSYEQLLLWTLNVRRAEFDFGGGGAIASLGLKPMDPTAVTLSGVEANSSVSLLGLESGAVIVAVALALTLAAVSFVALQRRSLQAPSKR